jgi:hypothetical protein
MSTVSLLDTEKQKSSTPKYILGLLGLILVFSAGGYGIWSYIDSVEREESRAKLEKEEKERLRDSILMLLAQPRFSGDKFREHMLGDADLRRFYVSRQEVYFSLPELDSGDFEEKISKFILDKERIEKASERDGWFYLDKYSFKKTPETAVLFKTQLDNIEFDPKPELSFKFEKATYTLRLKELIDFTSNEMIYGGRLNAATGQKNEGRTIIFSNHGIMVAKPKEPSLERFIDELLKDVPDKENREVKIQTLLDFVTNEIFYDYAEALSSYETLKRPNETLMSRRADCSNKTILMASFLEQIGEDYLLLYSPGHITVAVPQGKFPNENKLSYEWNGKPWVIAETTLPNFQIGKTNVKEAVNLKRVQYVQKPRQTNIIFDASTFMPLKFF